MITEIDTQESRRLLSSAKTASNDAVKGFKSSWSLARKVYQEAIQAPSQEELDRIAELEKAVIDIEFEDPKFTPFSLGSSDNMRCTESGGDSIDGCVYLKPDPEPELEPVMPYRLVASDLELAEFVEVAKALKGFTGVLRSSEVRQELKTSGIQAAKAVTGFGAAVVQVTLAVTEQIRKAVSNNATSSALPADVVSNSSSKIARDAKTRVMLETGVKGLSEGLDGLWGAIAEKTRRITLQPSNGQLENQLPTPQMMTSSEEM